MKTLLALGDCNTLGVGDLRDNAYPERLGRQLGRLVKNRGWTMATTREGLNLARDNLQPDVDILLIQYGLVDSYTTFRYAPYVLYYPDNPLRKQYRSLVKKYRKVCRRWGLYERFGSREVVGPREYEANLEAIIRLAGSARVVLVETVPHLRQERNANIRRYNDILTDIAARRPNVIKVDLFNLFLTGKEMYYLDETHCNATGHELIARRIAGALS